MQSRIEHEDQFSDQRQFREGGRTESLMEGNTTIDLSKDL
jgi:hypothetical protein